MDWRLYLAILLISLVVHAFKSGITFLWSLEGIGFIVAIAGILYNHLGVVRKPIRQAVLWLLNNPLEWEIKGLLTCAVDSGASVSVERLKELFLQTLEKHPKLRYRAADFSIQGEPTRTGLAIFHRGLGAAVSFRLTQSTMVGPDPMSLAPEWQVVVTFNASIGYRQTTATLAGVINDFFLELEQAVNPTEAKYEASISVEERNPFIGVVMQQLGAGHLQSFSVLANLSNRTSLEANKRRVNLVSFERSDFIHQTRDLLHKVA